MRLLIEGFMKVPFLALAATVFLTSCAGMQVTRTQVATGATSPTAIYIRPFSVAYAQFNADTNRNGAAIRKSLIPSEFSSILQEELAKIAPARVLKADEYPPKGWLVEGEFEVIDASNALARSTPAGGLGAGKSYAKLHVRITDLGDGPIKEVTRETVKETKDASIATTKSVKSYEGRVIYEFDVEGGSGTSGLLGSIYTPGSGNPVPFDLRNAAERIYLALTPDPFRYGYRSSPSDLR
jgi:hypothetical protein